MNIKASIFIAFHVSLVAQAADILIVSHYDETADYLKYTIKNQKDYAKYNGYNHTFRTGILSDGFRNEEAETGPLQSGAYWQKIVALREALHEINPKTREPYQWVMWVDADFVFTNMNKTLENVIETYAKPETNLLIAPDHYATDYLAFFGLGACAVNTGVFMLRNTQWSKDFLTRVSDSFEYYKTSNLPDQIAIGELLGDFDNTQLSRLEKMELVNKNPNVVVVDQRTFNAMWLSAPTTPETSLWHAGDLGAHFFGPNAFKSIIPKFLDCLKKTQQGGKDCESSWLDVIWYGSKAGWEMIFGKRSY